MGLKIYHQNIRGLYKNHPLLEKFIYDNRKMDLISLSETHIGGDLVNESLYKIPGFDFIKRDRKFGKGGGVSFYIADHLVYKRREDLECEMIESLWIEIFLKNAKSFFVSVIYRPPDGSSYLPPRFNYYQEKMLSKALKENKETIIMGDINVDYLKKNNEDIKEIFRLHGLRQLIKEPTRITTESSTLIDVLLTNKPDVISSSNVISSSLSDHKMIECVRKINHIKTSPPIINCRNYSKYDISEVSRSLNSKNWSPLYNMTNVNAACSFLNSILKDVIDIHAPQMKKKVKGKHSPWLTLDLKLEMNQRDVLLRKARKSKAPNDWKLYKQCRNRCNNKIRYEKENFNKTLIEENSNQPEKFWNIVKEIVPFKQNALKIKSTTNVDNKSKANNFCDFFSTISHKIKKESNKLKNFIWYEPDHFPLRTVNVFRVQPITELFVAQQLKRLKKKKATGLDGIPPKFLKEISPIIAKPVCFIINLSLESCQIPNEWKLAKIVPIHKSGNISEANNFRPISILPVLSKVLERAMHHQLSNYLEDNHLLSIQQFGYRKNRSTELATLNYIDNIRRCVDQGNLVGSVFIDLTKAFDT